MRFLKKASNKAVCVYIRRKPTLLNGPEQQKCHHCSGYTVGGHLSSVLCMKVSVSQFRGVLLALDSHPFDDSID